MQDALLFGESMTICRIHDYMQDRDCLQDLFQVFRTMIVCNNHGCICAIRRKRKGRKYEKPVFNHS
jgi:hypothetical protein